MGYEEGTVPAGSWSEQESQTFIDSGRYFVPEREGQIETIVDLVPAQDGLFVVWELCCGEGLLAQALLERFPAATVVGFDGSPAMLSRAGERLTAFGTRFQPRLFDLVEQAWRQVAPPVQAVVSSLAIHHLDGAGKAQLFRDIYGILQPGGALIIADLVEPSHLRGWQVAAKAWDDAVRAHALALDGNTDAFTFFEREKWNMYRHFDPNDIDHPSPLFDQLKWLEQAGFAAVDVYWMKAGHAIFGGVRSEKE